MDNKKSLKGYFQDSELEDKTNPILNELKIESCNL